MMLDCDIIDICGPAAESIILAIRKMEHRHSGEFGWSVITAMAKRKKSSAQREQPEPVQEVVWPTPFRSIDRLPTPKSLIIAWKPMINGWDIVLGRTVIDAPEEYTHWLPMIPRPK